MEVRTSRDEGKEETKGEGAGRKEGVKTSKDRKEEERTREEGGGE